MRITILHDRPKQEMKQSVERSVDQLFTGLNLGPIEFSNQQRQWSGDTMAFSLIANIGFMQTPIRGWALVSDHDVTLDVDLGLLGKLLPESAAKAQVAQRATSLLGK